MITIISQKLWSRINWFMAKFWVICAGLIVTSLAVAQSTRTSILYYVHIIREPLRRYLYVSLLKPKFHDWKHVECGCRLWEFALSYFIALPVGSMSRPIERGQRKWPVLRSINGFVINVFDVWIPMRIHKFGTIAHICTAMRPFEHIRTMVSVSVFLYIHTQLTRIPLINDRNCIWVLSLLMRSFRSRRDQAIVISGHVSRNFVKIERDYSHSSIFSSDIDVFVYLIYSNAFTSSRFSFPVHISVRISRSGRIVNFYFQKALSDSSLDPNEYRWIKFDVTTKWTVSGFSFSTSCVYRSRCTSAP